jgi:hypothetical protein
MQQISPPLSEAITQVVGLSAALAVIDSLFRAYHLGDRELLGRSPEAARLSFPKPHTAGFQLNS